MESNIFNQKRLFLLDKRLDLDTVATVFPLAFSDKHRSLVSLNVSLNEKVDINTLQLALDNLVLRFPTIFVRLHQDRFNFYLEKINQAPRVIEITDDYKPLNMSIKDLKQCAFKILVKDNRIIFEFFHAISDGFGGSVFLKSLVIEYLSILYDLEVSDKDNILLAKESFEYDETKDAFPEIVSTYRKKANMGKVYTLKNKVENIYVSEFIFNSKELLRKAKQYNVTLTSLLAGILTMAIYDVQKSEGRSSREIKLSIPIDLRRRFNDHKTLRNFTLPSLVSAGVISDEVPLSTICQLIDNQLKDNISQEELSSEATYYVNLTKNKALHYAPLFIKKWIIRLYLYIFKFGYSITFSNLGVWSIPSNFKKYINDFSIAISPKPSTPYSCGVASVNETLTITLTRSISEPLLETRILSILDDLLLEDNFEYKSTTL